eukprot:6185041-Pleurochrysis_carterae.AAC.4
MRSSRLEITGSERFGTLTPLAFARMPTKHGVAGALRATDRRHARTSGTAGGIAEVGPCCNVGTARGYSCRRKERSR